MVFTCEKIIDDFVCVDCHKTYSSGPSLRNHRVKFHNQISRTNSRNKSGRPKGSLNKRGKTERIYSKRHRSYQKCIDCSKEFNSIYGLGVHVGRSHDGPKSYFDKHHRRENDGICLVCQKITSFISISQGYKETCSISCGSTLAIKEMTKDDRNIKSKRLSISHRKRWDSYDEDTKKNIGKKISKTNRNLLSQMTPEERSDKYRIKDETKANEFYGELALRAMNNIGGMGKTLNGQFIPTNPEKYRGNVGNIIYRSRPELVLMRRFDQDPNILEWSSEEIIVPYTCKTDGRFHRYYPDFWIKRKSRDGSIKKILIEYKPESQTRPPIKGTKKEKTFIRECLVWAKNSAKWAAARTWCDMNDAEFVILSERHVLVNGA